MPRQKIRAMLPLLIVLVVFGGLGVYFLVRSYAATPTASVELEDGTITSPVTKVTDSTASGGGAIKFGPSIVTPPVTALVDTNFDSFPVSSPMSLANFRSAMGDPLVNGNLAVASIRSEAGRGNYMRVTLPADAIGGGSGMSSTPKLSKAVDEASIQYDVRFAGAFDWSLGGKIPGLGGFVPGTTDSASGCVAGSSQTWSGRAMWGGGGSWIGYMYGKFKTHSCGDGVTTGKTFTANQWHKVKQYYKLNTIAADGTVNADGIHKMWLDGVLVVNNNSFKYRDNNALHITHMFWSIFRGGSTPDWGSPTPGPIDFDNLLVSNQ